METAFFPSNCISFGIILLSFGRLKTCWSKLWNASKHPEEAPHPTWKGFCGSFSLGNGLAATVFVQFGWNFLAKCISLIAETCVNLRQDFPLKSLIPSRVGLTAAVLNLFVWNFVYAIAYTLPKIFKVIYLLPVL